MIDAKATHGQSFVNWNHPFDPFGGLLFERKGGERKTVEPINWGEKKYRNMVNILIYMDLSSNKRFMWFSMRNAFNPLVFESKKGFSGRGFIIGGDHPCWLTGRDHPQVVLPTNFWTVGVDELGGWFIWTLTFINIHQPSFCWLFHSHFFSPQVVRCYAKSRCFSLSRFQGLESSLQTLDLSHTKLTRHTTPELPALILLNLWRGERRSPKGNAGKGSEKAWKTMEIAWNTDREREIERER